MSGMYSPWMGTRETTRAMRFRYIVHMNLTVLLGGTSSERDVSLASGLRIAHALREIGHRVTCVDPAHGELTRADEDAMRSAGVVKKAPPTRESLQVMTESSRLATIGAMPAVERCGRRLHRAARRRGRGRHGSGDPRSLSRDVHGKRSSRERARHGQGSVEAALSRGRCAHCGLDHDRTRRRS